MVFICICYCLPVVVVNVIDWIHTIYSVSISVVITHSLPLSLSLSFYLSSVLLFILKFYHSISISFAIVVVVAAAVAYKTVHFTPHVSFICTFARFHGCFFVHLLVQMAFRKQREKKESTPKTSIFLYADIYVCYNRAEFARCKRAQKREREESINCRHDNRYWRSFAHTNRQTIDKTIDHSHTIGIVHKTKSHFIIMRSKCKLIMHTDDVPDYIPIPCLSISLPRSITTFKVIIY